MMSHAAQQRKKSTFPRFLPAGVFPFRKYESHMVICLYRSWNSAKSLQIGDSGDSVLEIRATFLKTHCVRKYNGMDV